ncbi:UNVERIFIED_CONTAM: hypothetical protein Sradi_1065800 [Sesamum radiatum]|uniref:Uncharacterized protein n=1 Tax=Sesamum radiatum TaxID=300843 RepID=A0AAW2VA00_SESRA
MAKSEGKKTRKRVEGEDGSSDVRKGEEMDAIDVKINAIGENTEEKTSPIIGYFPSGYDPMKNSINPDPNSSVKVYKSVNSRNPRNPRMQVVVGVRGSEVKFVGTNYSGEATTPQLCNYALGVLDKETRVLKMVPIAANRIFRLEPKFAALEAVAEKRSRKE